jgi:predicted dehydrogenase
VDDGVSDAGRPLRVAVVGLGWIGEAHLADLAGRPDVTVTAVCDVDPAKAASCAERHGARAFTDLETLLAQEELDAVWICTPPRHHLAPTLRALERGVPVYLEKPVARNAEDALAIVEAVDRSGLVCAVGYQWHALEVLDTLRAELSGQRVGYLLNHSIGPTAARSWFLDRDEGGGNLLERGSHHIDLVRAVAGEVTAVRAVAGEVRIARPQARDQDIDDALTLILHLAGGGVATLAIAWTQDDAPGSYGMDVVASDSTLHLALDPHFRLTGRSRGKEVDVTAEHTPFTRSNSRFLAAVRAADPSAVACTPADALATLRVALAGEEALASGERVEVR